MYTPEERMLMAQLGAGAGAGADPSLLALGEVADVRISGHETMKDGAGKEFTVYRVDVVKRTAPFLRWTVFRCVGGGGEGARVVRADRAHEAHRRTGARSPMRCEVARDLANACAGGRSQARALVVRA
jgi:hypothetical protein